MNARDTERDSDVPRGGLHPDQAQGTPGTTPEAEDQPTFEGGRPTPDQAAGIPDEPLKPRD